MYKKPEGISHDIVYLKTDSGRLATVVGLIMNPSNLIWTDVDSGDQCILNFNEQQLSISAVGECSHYWKGQTFLELLGLDGNT